MSTISKLCPEVRRERARRRDMVRSLERVILMLRGMPLLKAAATYNTLVAIQRNPAMSASRKSALFTRLTYEAIGD